jgi:hypothetical protein
LADSEEAAVSEATAKYVEARQAVDKAKKRKINRSPQEKRALELMRKEADRYGVQLENDGEGGLPSSLVLRVMRRDKYRCKACGKRRPAPISVHHKGGIVESEWLDSKGHKNEPSNIVTICTKCHDKIHTKARDEGVDSSQVKPAGDDYKGQHGHD